MDGQKDINWPIAAKLYTSFRSLMRDLDSEELHVDTGVKSPKRSGQKRKRDENEASLKVSPDLLEGREEGRI